MSLPALLGGIPVADADTYPSWPQWGEHEREELLATLDSGAWWTGDGERALRFARDFARYQGAMAGYPFTNGTPTLEAALVPVAEHAAASTVWMEHRLLLADRDRVLRVAHAAARIHEHAAAIVEKLPIGAGA